MTPTRRLAFYSRVARLPWNWRAKVFAFAFAGTHAPLLAIVAWLTTRADVDLGERLLTLLVALVATLLGTGATLWSLNALLQPVLLTSEALRRYREGREPVALPVDYPDEVGTLMADAQRTVEQLSSVVDALRYVDEPTGLSNRSRLEQRVAARIELGAPFLVVVARLANHPVVAETFGTSEADGVIRLIAGRISAHPLGDETARVAPDALAFLVGLPAEDSRWVALGDRIRGAVGQWASDVELGGIVVRPRLYAGLAAWPHDGAEAVALLDRAVSASALATDDAPVMMHSPEHRKAALERFQLESELRRALDRDEFELHYQPVVDMAEGRTVAAEALIRWRHPARGLVMPGHFVPLAEATGLIDPIGWWVVRRACAQLQAWNQDGHRLRVAVNLSAQQFGDPDVIRRVLDAIADHHISPDQLELELTESTAMADHDHTRAMFGRLRDEGVGIAIDDFGTGWSSLSWLRRLPFDKLKIDREFVAGVDRVPQGQAICTALIELSRGLGLKVVAEGTESEQEVRFLVGRGCRLFQGYWFSRPVPPDVLAAGLDRRYVLTIPPSETPLMAANR